MASTEQEYLVTKQQIRRFEEALLELEGRSPEDPAMLELQRDALQSQLNDLRSEAAEYEAQNPTIFASGQVWKHEDGSSWEVVSDPGTSDRVMLSGPGPLRGLRSIPPGQLRPPEWTQVLPGQGSSDG